MADHRTKAQREANELDLQMFNLARRIEKFSAEIARPGEKRPFLGVARDLQAHRSTSKATCTRRTGRRSMSDFHARALDITRRSLAAKAKRDREFMELLTLNLAVAVAAAAFLFLGLPEQQRLDRVNQEIAYHD